MEVYLELAIAENFCMDFTLLYSAKAASSNRAGYLKIAAAAVFGACFAVVAPLLNVGAAGQIALKICSGLLMCFIAGKFQKVAHYVRFTAYFSAFSALLAGVLIGIFSLPGLKAFSGEGYLISSVPIGIPLFGALMLVIVARKVAEKLKSRGGGDVSCRIKTSMGEVNLQGFFDSGNRVYLRGEPVCVIPLWAAQRLADLESINDGVKIHTVTGSTMLKVFTADLEIDQGGKIIDIKSVKMGVSKNRIERAVLHPDIGELNV